MARARIALAGLATLMVACVSPTSPPTPTPNIQATVGAAVQEALAAIQTPTFTASPTSTPDLLASATGSTLDQLVVREVPAGIPEYSRSQWADWIDEDGDCQNTRHEVLIDESLEPVAFKSSAGCQVASARWVAPYTGTVVVDASALDIDHMVPLKNAHLSGGWAWSPDRKAAFANDLSDPDHLIAVTASANRSKGARGPEEWRPPDSSYWCEYATDWVRIKGTWSLSVTPPELAALHDMLDTCRDGDLPASPSPDPASSVAAPPTPTATSMPPTATPTRIHDLTPTFILPPTPTLVLRSCCKYCSKGKACGDTCISRSYTCRVGPGCACNR